MDNIVFDPKTETLHYPGGVQETLKQREWRKYRFNYIEELQNALEGMKVLYQNPGCLTEDGYKKAKEKIQESFDYWEMNVFVEFEDANAPFDVEFEDGN